jgi:hypothetical protein
VKRSCQWFVVMVTVVLSGACSSSKGNSGDGGPAGEGGGGGASSAILANVYQLVSDSNDGMKPAAGATITLNFLPNGKALFFALSSTETLSYHGT